MSYQLGDVLRVIVYGFVVHEGIYTGEGTVISNSRRNGLVIEESVSAFSQGRKITNAGRLSELSPHVAIAHARTRLGQKYRLYSDNCQHFVRRCYHIKPKSPQRDVVVAGVAIALGLLLVF